MIGYGLLALLLPPNWIWGGSMKGGEGSDEFYRGREGGRRNAKERNG